MTTTARRLLAILLYPVRPLIVWAAEQAAQAVERRAAEQRARVALAECRRPLEPLWWPVGRGD